MPQKPPGDQLTVRDTFNGMHLVALLYAICVLPFLRSKSGKRAYGIPAIATGVILFYFGICTEDPWVMGFWALWLFVICVRIGESYAAERRGELRHTQYGGWPWLASKVVRSEDAAKRWIEPLLCGAIGYGVYQVSQYLGLLIMSAGMSLAFLFTLYTHIRDRREDAMIDAQLEAEYFSSRTNDRLRR